MGIYLLNKIDIIFDYILAFKLKTKSLNKQII